MRAAIWKPGEMTSGSDGNTAHDPLQASEPSLKTRQADRTVLAAAVLFALVGLGLQWWRLQVLTASMDQGIFLQVLWNSLRGHPFESTLSSQLSSNVVHAGQLPALGYPRLGQHFTPILLIWAPLVGVMGKWALPLVQVGLMTAAGLVLFRLARQHLAPAPASWIALSFFASLTVIGPTWGNFTDLCQLPLCFFLLLLGLDLYNRWLILFSALALPLIREDTGILLIGVGLWMAVRQPQRWRLAAALALWGGGWVGVVTNVLMPLFSDDIARRFMVENFGHYIPQHDRASSLEVLQEVLGQPLVLLRELVNPPGRTLAYLAAQGLPLLFVPLISLDSWLLMGLPLTGLLLAQGSNDPLSINIRYTLLVVPGLFAGAIAWWQRHPHALHSRRLRRVWAGCIILSLLVTLTGNPNRSLSWLIPDSIQPWVYSSPWRQWRHGLLAQAAIRPIPRGASVAASTPLIPHLADRAVLVRFPNDRTYLDRRGQAQQVDWIAVDLDWLERYAVAFRSDRALLSRSLSAVHNLQGSYGVQRVLDGVVVLQRHGPPHVVAQQQLSTLLKEIQIPPSPSSGIKADPVSTSAATWTNKKPHRIRWG